MTNDGSTDQKSRFDQRWASCETSRNEDRDRERRPQKDTATHGLVVGGARIREAAGTEFLPGKVNASSPLVKK